MRLTFTGPGGSRAYVEGDFGNHLLNNWELAVWLVHLFCLAWYHTGSHGFHLLLDKISKYVNTLEFIWSAHINLWLQSNVALILSHIQWSVRITWNYNKFKYIVYLYNHKKKTKKKIRMILFFGTKCGWEGSKKEPNCRCSNRSH